MSNKILTADYTTKLPSPKLLSQEIEKTKRMFALRKAQSDSQKDVNIKPKSIKINKSSVKFGKQKKVKTIKTKRNK